MRLSSLALVLPLAAACTGSVTGEGNPDRVPPTIEIDSPARGAMGEESSIVVHGRALDDRGITELTVNGQRAEVSPSGEFEVVVQGEPGITTIETIATDLGGNQARDARATLTGTLAEQGTPVADAIVARVDRQTLAGMASMIGGYASAADFGAIAAANNPVMDSGSSCNNARVDVRAITKDSVKVTMVPTVAGIEFSIDVANLRVESNADWEIICFISGSTGVDVTASHLRATGLLALGIADGDLALSLPTLDIAFEGFDIDYSGIPDDLVDLITGDLTDEVATALDDMLSAMVPELGGAFMAELVAAKWDATVLGKTIELSLAPRTLAWSAEGGVLALEFNAIPRDIEGAMYLSTPKPAPTMIEMGAEAQGFRIAVADDVGNQLLAAMWAGGGFDAEFALEPGSALAGPLSGQADRIHFDLSLPPVLAADTRTGSMRLTFGDLMVRFSQGETTMLAFALSAGFDLEVSISDDGRIVLATGEPTVLAQLLEKSDAISFPIDDAVIAAFAAPLLEQIGGQSDQLLGVMPVPALGDLTLTDPSIEALGGYLVVGAGLGLSTP